MDYVAWNEDQAGLLLAAMTDVATAGGDETLTETDRQLLHCASEHIFHLPREVEALGAASPEELAEALTDERERQRAITFLTLPAYSEAEICAPRLARIERFASALGVETDALRDLQRIRDGQMFRLKLDFLRKMMAAGFFPEGNLVTKLGAAIQLLKEQRGDASVAKRFQALEHLPEGTLGRAYFDFYRLRGYSLPGEKGCIPEAFITVHDSSHILGGFNTDQAGEIGVAAFQAGYVERHPYEVLLDGLAAFQLDIMLDPPLGVPSSRGLLDPHLLMVGLERGMKMPRDLMRDWDYGSDFERPVETLRAEFGIDGADDLWLSPPPPKAGDNRAQH